MHYINKQNINKLNDKYAEYVCNKTSELVKKKLEEFIRYYYKEYDPEQYQRTWKFLNSIVKTKAEKLGNEWVATVYIDTSIQYSSMWNGKHWNMGNTVYLANQGRHGNTKVGDMQFFNDAYEEILNNKHLTSSFISYMRKYGIQIKYEKL